MKRALILVVALGAAARATASPPIIDAAGDVPGEPAAPIAALLRGDAAAFASQVAAPLRIQDLWFDTKPCRAFEGPQQVEAARLPALVRCFAALGVRPSGQRTFFYGPGILIRGALADGRLTALAGPVPIADGAPVVEGPALADHVAGLSPALPPDAALARRIDAKPGARALAIVTVCFDERGRVMRADATASPGFDAYGTQVLAIAHTWRARPFLVHGARVPVCARLVFGYPMPRPAWLSIPVPPPPPMLGDLAGAHGTAPPTPAGARIVAPTALEGHRTGGTVQIEPDDATKLAMQAKHVSRVVGSWKICVTTTGTVSEVVALRPTGWARYDAKIAAELARWTYTPYEVDGKPVPVCTAVTFIYRQH